RDAGKKERAWRVDELAIGIDEVVNCATANSRALWMDDHLVPGRRLEPVEIRLFGWCKLSAKWHTGGNGYCRCNVVQTELVLAGVIGFGVNRDHIAPRR